MNNHTRASHMALASGLVGLLFLLGGPVSPEKPPENAENVAAGKKIYAQACVWCHGGRGGGDGPAAYFIAARTAPRPRDFTSGIFKFRTTPSGELPTDEDLFRVVTHGIPGYMPSYRGLPELRRWQVIYYVKSLSPEFQQFPPSEMIAIGDPLPATSASVTRGREVYVELKCAQCHGADGFGDGVSAGELEDDWGMKIVPGDLTNPSAWKGGGNPRDLYRTFITGLTGTPMPAYQEILEGREEDAWHLVNYVLSISASR